MGELNDEPDMAGKRRNAINIRDKGERWIEGGKDCEEKVGGDEAARRAEDEEESEV